MTVRHFGLVLQHTLFANVFAIQCSLLDAFILLIYYVRYLASSDSFYLLLLHCYFRLALYLCDVFNLLTIFVIFSTPLCKARKGI